MGKPNSVEQVILDALERAFADPTPRKLHGTRVNPGIFLSASAIAKNAASRCLEQNLLRQVGEQRVGSRVTPLFGITPAGIALVLHQSPAPRLLAAMMDATERMANSAARCEETLREVAKHTGSLHATLQQVAGRIRPPDLARILEHSSNSQVTPAASQCDVDASLDENLVSFIYTRKSNDPLRPVDLPDLFRKAAASIAALSIGQFHDSVRRLASQKRLRLIPFTQALYQLAEPEYALIVGREVMYYAEPGSNADR